MELEGILMLVDAAAKLSVVLTNSLGSDSAVAKLIEDRKASPTAEWTDEQRAQVEAMLVDAKAYAAAELEKPDAAT